MVPFRQEFVFVLENALDKYLAKYFPRNGNIRVFLQLPFRSLFNIADPAAGQFEAAFFGGIEKVRKQTNKQNCNLLRSMIN